MLRRLYFLFPDTGHAKAVVEALEALGVDRQRIHAVAENDSIDTLPVATARQAGDVAGKVEWLVWNMNLLLFILAVVALIVSLSVNAIVMAVLSAVVMLVTFFSGGWFVWRIPDVHLSQFSDALAHGEILLMVDVSVSQVERIEDYVHRHHPEACIGGVGWSVDAFGL